MVYSSLSIKEKGSTGTGKNAQTNYDQMYVFIRDQNGTNGDDLKIVCLYTESGSNNPVRISDKNLETRVSILNETFG